MNTTMRIQPLNKTNYDTWKIQAEALLIKTGSWEYVNGSKKRPTADPSKDSEVQEVALWNSSDQKAKSDLILSLDVSELREVKHCKTSRDVWQKLAAVHESRGPAKKANLLKQLLFSRMNEGEDVQTHLDKLESIVDKLRDMELEINEDLLTIILLYSLPDSFDNFRVAIESRDTLPKMENLKIKIIEESGARHDRQESQPTNNAFAVWKKKIPRQPNQQMSKQQSSKKLLKCTKCKRKGHQITECWFNQKNESYFASEICTSAHEDAPKSDWILDSGCTSHMCNNKDKFEDLKPTIKQVNMANQTNSESVGIGSVKLNVKVGDKLKTCDLSNTLYVPSLDLNLLSVAKITEKGYNVTFYEDKALIKNKNNNTTTVAVKENNLYVIKQTNHSDEQANVCARQEDKTFDLWHNRFGHLNVKTLGEMIQQNSVLGMKPLPKKLKTQTKCEICFKGKMTREKFPKSISYAKEILEIVHTDLCGPMPVASNGGALYVITFTDAKSGYTVVNMLKKKSDAYEALVNYHKMAERQTGKKLKYLQSDNGLEFVNRQSNDYLKSHGIQRRLSAPYTPEQNGTAERKNRTLLEMARCMLFQSNCRPSFWAEAVAAANYTRNRCVSRSSEQKTPFEHWFGRKPVITHLRTFGSKAYVLNKRPNRNKLQPRSEIGILVGYNDESKAYRIWMLQDERIVVSRDVKFIEGEFVKNSEKDLHGPKCVDIHFFSNKDEPIRVNDDIVNQETEQDKIVEIEINESQATKLLEQDTNQEIW